MCYDGFFMRKLIPGVCFYGFTDTIPFTSMTQKEMATYMIDGEFDEKYQYPIYGPKRIQIFDSPETIQNRYAYAQIFLSPVKPTNRLDAWMYLTSSLKIIDFMKHEGGISDEVLAVLERVIWSTCDITKHVKRIYRKIFNHIIYKIAVKVYEPDYVWSTGRRKGMTTIKALMPVFEEHVMSAS
jgi:hypothetical protein